MRPGVAVLICIACVVILAGLLSYIFPPDDVDEDDGYE